MIQYTKEYLNSERNISNIVKQAKGILEHREMLYNRYAHKSDEVSVPIEYYINNIASGYFGGKAPEFTIKQETDETKKEIIRKLFDKQVGENADSKEFQMLIDYIRDYNDDDTFFYEIVKDYFITGACYGLLYETTNNEIVYARVPSTQTVAIYDYSTPAQKIALVRIWQELDDNGQKVDMVEVITEDNRRYYRNSVLQPEEYKEDIDMMEEVMWELVPAFAVENPDNISICEPVLTLIDTYEQIIKNNKNTFQYNDDAKLMVTGFTPEQPSLIENENGELIANPARTQEDNKLLSSKVFYTPDGNGKIEWIIKNINDTASENHKKTLIELILMTTCIPNVTDTGFTNADNSSALEKKFFPLEQILIEADKLFKKELLSLWENIVDRINKKKNTRFDFREIDIQMKRNMPQDKNDMVNMALQLRGLLSDETIIGMLPFELDIQTELSKLEEDTDDEITREENQYMDIEEVDNVEQDRQSVEQIPEEL